MNDPKIGFTASGEVQILTGTPPVFLRWLGFRLEKFGSSGSAGGYFPGTLLFVLRKERPVAKWLQGNN
jgi:hypothetical protein